MSIMQFPVSDGAAAATVKAMPYRVSGITINETTCDTTYNPRSSMRSALRSLLPRSAAAVVRRFAIRIQTTPVDPVAALWAVLDRCVVPAEHRFLAHFGGGDIPSALVKIEVTSPWDKAANDSIIDPLVTDYPALVRSLKVLNISFNEYDESAALGDFAAMATQLQELTFQFCGLTSVLGLKGRCEYLRKVDLFACKRRDFWLDFFTPPAIFGRYHLITIDALADRAYLEEVNVSGTAITSIEPLRSCPNLTKVHLYACQQLSSIDALAGHQSLQEVDASRSGITSIEPLNSCPTLTKVGLKGCSIQLPVDLHLPASVIVIQ